jgi:flap endonuclease-1
LVDLRKNLRSLEISLDQLIDIGLLIGTDYNPKGIKGIGPKTALKLVKKHDTIKEALLHVKNPTFPYPIEEIKELFLNPRVTDEYSLEWSAPDASGILDFLCEEHNFSKNRVIRAVEKIEKGYAKKTSESTLDKWFT